MSTIDPPNADRPSQPADVAHAGAVPTSDRDTRGQLNLATRLGVFAAIVCAVGLVYGRAIHAPFLYDDLSSVQANTSIVRLWPLLGDGANPGPLTPLKDNVTSGRPLVNLTYALNYRFGGLNTTGYHVVSLLIHALNATLLFAVARGALRSNYFAHRYDPVATGLSLAIALVWAVHPLQVDSVEYISQRTELMVAFFYFSTLFASQRYFAATTAQGRGAWLIVAAAACALGACCKEVIVTAPVLMLLYDRTFEARSFRQALAQHWPLYAGLLLSWGVIFALNISGPRANTAGFNLGVVPMAWWFTQAKVLAMYFKLVIWPWPLIIHYHVPYITSLRSALPWLTLVGIIGLFVLRGLWQRKAVGYLGAWVFLILSPTLVVPIISEVAAERRMYLPLAAIVSLGVVLLYELIVRVKTPQSQAAVELAGAEQSPTAAATHQAAQGASPITIALACAACVAVLLACVSMIRLTAYRDQVSIFQDAVYYQPDDPICTYTLGNCLIEAGRPQEAIPHLRHTIELRDRPTPGIHKQLGIALMSTRAFDEASEHLELAVEEHPDDVAVRRLYGMALLNAGRNSEAVPQLERVAQSQPDQVEDIDRLAAALVNSNRLEAAIGHLQHVLKLRPDFYPARFKLAIAYAKMGRADDAAVACEQALAQAREKGDFETAANISGLLKTLRENKAAPSSGK